MKKILTGVGVIVLAAGAYWAYATFVRVEPLPDGLIQANGRLEGDQMIVASKYPGRVLEFFVNEGDNVTAGQKLAQLDDKEIKTKVRQAEEGVAALKHEVEAARSNYAQAQRDAKRFEDLLAEGTATKRETEEAALGLDVAQQKLEAGRNQLHAAEAAYDEAGYARDEMTLFAPSAGVITNRLQEPGAVVAAGAPLLSLVNLDNLYLKVYVPEKQIGKLRLKLPAKIYTDAFPDAPFDASVGFIASRAEFTPKEVQTPDERVKLVYAVKLNVKDNPDHRLAPGIPADAVIRWDDTVEWVAPRW